MRPRAGGGASPVAPECPVCGQDFVELRGGGSNQGAPGGGRHVEAQVVITASGAGGGVTGDAVSGAWSALLAEVLSSPLLAGAHLSASDPLLGTNSLAPGDFVSGDAVLEQILGRLLESYVPTSTPAHPDIVAALPRVRPDAAAAKDGCPVCLGSFSAEGVDDCAAGGEGRGCTAGGAAGGPDGEGEVLQLPCGHCFHGGCIRPWLLEHNTCPVCRHELPGEEPGGGAAGSAEEGIREGGLEVVGTAVPLSPGQARPGEGAAAPGGSREQGGGAMAPPPCAAAPSSGAPSRTRPAEAGAHPDLQPGGPSPSDRPPAPT